MHFLVACVTEGVAPCWLLAGDDPSLKAAHASLPHGPLCGQFTTWLFASSRPEGGSLTSVSYDGIYAVRSVAVTSHWLCHIVVIRNKSHVLPVICLHNGVNSKRWDCWGSPYRVLTTLPIWLSSCNASHTQLYCMTLLYSLLLYHLPLPVYLHF